MTGTYIDERQFKDIDNCMTYIQQVMPEINAFIKDLDLYSNGGNPFNLLPDFIRAADMHRLWKIQKPAAQRAQHWFALTERVKIARLHLELDEIDYLISHLLDTSSDAPPEQRFPIALVAKLPLPVRQLSAAPPQLNCSGLLDVYHRRVMVIAGDLYNDQEAFKAQRMAIAQAVPRFSEYMQTHLGSFNGRCWPADRLTSARRRLKKNNDHYHLGINAKGNFITQHARISTLIERLNHGFIASVRSDTVLSFRLELQLILPLLAKAQGYTRELIALRNSAR